MSEHFAQGSGAMTVEAEQSVAFWKPYSKHIMLVSMRLLTLVSARRGACCVPQLVSHLQLL